MKNAAALLGFLLIATAAAAQAPTSGGRTYGEDQSITCLQGGQVIAKVPQASAVVTQWTEASFHLEYSDPAGGRHTKDFNPQAMTCVIEPLGPSGGTYGRSGYGNSGYGH